jgi:predicted TIM-barrel fold metal-dependent hydrolase
MDISFDGEQLLKIKQSAAMPYENNDKSSKSPKYKPNQDHIKQLRQFVEGQRDAIAGREPVAYQNIRALSDYMGFDALTCQAFEFLYAMRKDDPLATLVTEFAGKDYGLRCAIIASMTGNPGYGRAMATILGTSGPLMQSGFLESICVDDDDYDPYVSDSIFTSLEQLDIEMDDLVAHLFPSDKARTSELTLADFDDLGPQLDALVKRIVTAVDNGETGVNVLLHGAPGVGKSELARAIARSCDYRCVMIGESEAKDNRPEAQKRIADARRINALVRHIDSKMIGVMDEAEDLLLKTGDSSKSADPHSKVAVNTLLEDNRIPTIFTVNDPHKFHPSFKQRFDFIMNVPQRSIRQQARIWSEMLDKYGVSGVDPQQTLGLARQYNLAPREIETLAQLAASAPDPLPAIERQVREMAEAAKQCATAYNRPESVPPKFSPDFITARQADSSIVDTQALAATIRDSGDRFRGLISQEVGQGGTVLARYLAEQSDRQTLELDGGDISEPSPMTPASAKIAAAFGEAANLKAFLILSNFSGFQLEPESANGHWKVEALDTFMQYLKRHDGPVAMIMTGSGDSGAPELPWEYDHLVSNKMEMADLDGATASAAIAHYCGDGWSQELIESQLPDRGIRIGDVAKLGQAVALRPDRFEIVDDLCRELETIIERRRQGAQSRLGFHKPAAA